MAQAFDIRQASPADAAGMARVHVLSWQSAYKGLLPQELIDGLSIETRTRQWGEWLEAPEAHLNLVACDSEGQVLGFVSGSPLRGDYAGFDSEVAAIYLLPQAQGLGMGKALFKRMQELLRERGYQRMLVWVLASNEAAKGFYQRLGGVETLGKRVKIGAASASGPVEVDELGYGFELV